MSAPVLVLFANPRSGSTLAAEYLKLPDGRALLPLSTGSVSLVVFNILDPEAKRKGFDAVRENLREGEVVRICVAGGDGSLIWMLQDLIEEGIPLEKVAVTTLPFGTGNDLAAMLGWGRKPITPLLDPDLTNLSIQAENWTHAAISSLDLWEVDMTLSDGGFFQKISKTGGTYRKTVLYDEFGVKTRFQRLMSNYFSIGVDARIGIGFDKARTRSQVINKAVYAWEGFKKLCCLPVMLVQDYVDSFEDLDSEDTKVVFDKGGNGLEEEYVTIIAQNIRNYAASDHHIWDTARGQVNKTLVPKEQSASDGLLEFLVFPSGFGIALEQLPLMQGNSRRLHQGRGPFRLRMTQQPRRPVYINVDGEYYTTFGLSEVTITLSRYSHELRVMHAAASSHSK